MSNTALVAEVLMVQLEFAKQLMAKPGGTQQ
jgi:16S rRNA A1518/A1519 N6-dimethyltransferase RsmA/KsgA/DIM1 with predicted DNA glycosylase/AP lyase activity